MPQAPQSFHARPRVPSSAGTRQRGRRLQRLRRQVFQRDGWACRHCGSVGTEQTLELDHVIPLHDGGPDAESNMQTLCSPCHASKTTAERQRGAAS